MSSISNSSIVHQISEWQHSFHDLQECIARLNLEENLKNLDVSDPIPTALQDAQEVLNGLVYLAESDQTTDLIADLKRLQQIISKAVTVFENAAKYKRGGCCNNLGQLTSVIKYNPINLLKTKPLEAHYKERIKIFNKIIGGRMRSLGRKWAIEIHQASSKSEVSTSVVSQQTRSSLQSYADEVDEYQIEQISSLTSIFEESLPKKSLLIFPNEVLLNIAQCIKSPKDFFNLSLACKRLFQISQIQGAFQCDLSGYIPNFLYLSNDPKVRLYSPRAACKIGKEVEHCSKKLENASKLLTISKFERRNYDPIALIRHPKWETVFPPYLKATFGDVLIVANHSHNNNNSIGTVLICDLEMKVERNLKVHDTNVFACVAVHSPAPQLVTLSENEFKIWDLEILRSGLLTEALIFHKTNVSLALSDCASIKNNNRKYPVIKAHKNLLAIGCEESVLLMDCSQESSNNRIKIESVNVRQIIISDSELLLVDGNDITLWSMEIVKDHLAQNLQLDYTSASGFWTLDRVKFGEIIKNKLFVAFKYDELWRNENDSFTYGQLYDLETGELFRNLNLKEGKKGEIFSVDFSGNNLITAGDFVALWDLSVQEDFPSQIYDNLQDNYVFKTYILGKKVLSATSQGVLQFRKTDLSLVGGMNKVIKASSYHPVNDKDKLVAFDFFGKYLFTQVRTECHQNLSRVYLIA